MTQSSLNAYIQGIESGNFDNDSEKILYLLRQQPMTMPQVGQILRKDPRQFSSRFSKLMDKGKIEITQTGKHSVYAIVINETKQSIIMRYRRQEKIDKWVEKGRELGLLTPQIEQAIFNKQLMLF